jgi:hypothetical protein
VQYRIFGHDLPHDSGGGRKAVQWRFFFLLFYFSSCPATYRHRRQERGRAYRVISVKKTAAKSKHCAAT